MADIEFVDEDDTADHEDEVLDTEARRRLPQWALPVAALLVLALVVAVVAVRHRGSSPQAAPVAPAPSTTAPLPLVGTPNIEVDDVYALVGDPRDSRLYALSSDRLYALALNGRQIGRGATVRLGAGPDAQALLLVDPVRHRIWVVPQSQTGDGGGSPGMITEFDSRTLRPIGRFALQVPVFSAQLLDGLLYLASSGKLYQFDARAGRAEPVLTTASDELNLVADASRHRLLYLGYGSPVRVGLWSPHGQVLAIPIPALGRFGGSLVVSDGAIWAGGASRHGGVLVRLDPRTLTAGRNVLRPAKVGSDVSLDGAGRRSLYLFSGSQSDTRVSCLDARSGRLLARVGPINGLFVTVGGRGFDGSAPSLHPVAMGRCPG